ncbi:hypothetical protein GQ55_9G559100 [Panicum hallii var. hallii]|uniref:Uncharacterized protein n=1 Tax=Panicum hallii var. hallii TaxID=1504633 RepID=A0A2T7CFP2_9POAL|nr:hypothetical protein GQ55_9G559100 [Panicum hallii var. hallii]
MHPEENGSWKDVQIVLHQIVNLVHNWKLLCPAGRLQELELMLEKLRYLISQPGS